MLSGTTIARLEEFGARHIRKGRINRVYFNSTMLGYSFDLWTYTWTLEPWESTEYDVNGVKAHSPIGYTIPGQIPHLAYYMDVGTEKIESCGVLAFEERIKHLVYR